MTGGTGFTEQNLTSHLGSGNNVARINDIFLGTPENLAEDVEFVEDSGRYPTSPLRKASNWSVGRT
jgi:UDP-glucose 4-epimerase